MARRTNTYAIRLAVEGGGQVIGRDIDAALRSRPVSCDLAVS